MDNSNNYELPADIKPKQKDTIIMLEDVRIAFPTLFTAEQVQGKGKPAFSATFLLAPDHKSIPTLKTAIIDVATAKWGSGAAEILKQLVAGDRICLHNGDAKANFEGFAGNKFVSTRSYSRPLIINNDRSALAEADGKPYSGCYVNGQIAVWAMQNTHGKRICAQLRGVQFLRDGQSFGGGGVAQVDEFDVHADGTDGEAPAASIDDFGDIL